MIISNNPRKHRRGVSFIEVVACLAIVALMCTMVLSMTSVIAASNKETENYNKLRNYAVNMFEKLHMDLENGELIDSNNYDDDGSTSGIKANVYVFNLGRDDSAFGKAFYYVEIKLVMRKTQEMITSKGFLREGCVAYAG